MGGVLICCNNRRLYCLKQHDKKRRRDGETESLQVCADVFDLGPPLSGGNPVSASSKGSKRKSAMPNSPRKKRSRYADQQ